MHDQDTPCVRLYCPACGLSQQHDGGTFACTNCGALVFEAEAFATEAQFWRTVLAVRKTYTDDAGLYHDNGIEVRLPDERRVTVPTEYAVLLAGHLLAAADGDYGDVPEAYFADKLNANDGSALWRALLKAHRAHRRAM